MKLSISDNGILAAYAKGYHVDKEGNILNPKNIKLKPNLKSNYYIFGLRYKNGQYSILVHRLQAYQKYGEELFKEGIVVRHKNGIKTDNSWDNILIGTSQENSLDIPIEKRILRTQGSTKIRQKYSNELIIYIRHKYMNGIKQIDLSRKFNIPKSGIHHILNSLYLFERIESSNIQNKKPDLSLFKDIIIDEINAEDIHLHLNKEYTI